MSKLLKIKNELMICKKCGKHGFYAGYDVFPGIIKNKHWFHCDDCERHWWGDDVKYDEAN